LKELKDKKELKERQEREKAINEFKMTQLKFQSPLSEPTENSPKKHMAMDLNMQFSSVND
jgi:hypothetical protein